MLTSAQSCSCKVQTKLPNAARIFLKTVKMSECAASCLRLVEDSEGLRLSLRDVQGVAAGVPSRVLVITQDDDAGTGFKLERMRTFWIG